MLNKVLENKNSVAIGGHIRPDGDCVGSCMGLALYLRDNYPEISVDVYLEKISEKFLFLSDTDSIKNEIEDKVYDLFICLDCGDVDRLGFSLPLYQSAKHTFCVDHHVSNNSFAENNVIEADASSTSELVYHLLDKGKISKQVAEALYMGIVHDTGVYQYSCASPQTMRTAAELMEKGINAPQIIEDTYYEKTFRQNHVLGRALMESILFQDGKCIAAYIRKKEMDFYEITSADLDGIVSHLRNTKGVEVAIFIYEIQPNVFKVSLRSKKLVDVSKIAQFFGGGGHERAAGFTLSGSPHDVINNISMQIACQLENKES